jgi:hypothetical protein
MQTSPQERYTDLSGDLGYAMAQNLRAKIPEADTLSVFDVNQTTLEKFSKEAVPSNVVVAGNPREVVENAVSFWSPPQALPCYTSKMMSHICSIYDLSWGPSLGGSFHDSPNNSQSSENQQHHQTTCA